MLPWNLLILLNDWSTVGAPYQDPRYQGDSNGRINVEMFITASLMPVIGTVIANLPEGYRPPKRLSFQTTSPNAPSIGGIQFDIMTNGDIVYQFPLIPGGSFLPLHFSFTQN